MLPQQFSNPRPPEIIRKKKKKKKKKKSACKINENDLKIAWKCTLRQSSFKHFPGEAPGPPYKRETPLIHSPSRGLRRSIHAFGSQCHPPPPPRLQTFWVQSFYWQRLWWDFYFLWDHCAHPGFFEILTLLKPDTASQTTRCIWRYTI